MMTLGRSVPRRASDGRIGRGWRRRTAVLLAITVTITSIVGYVALSFTVNGLPSYQPSAGWIAVLQPVTAPNVDTVQLLVQARTQGNQTRAAYDVVVCGPRPYVGDLLIGGSAQLAAIRPDPLLPASVAGLLRVQRLPDLVFYFGEMIDLGPVQRIHITMPDVSACPPAAAMQSSSALPGGTDEGVVGVTAEPVQPVQHLTQGRNLGPAPPQRRRHQTQTRPAARLSRPPRAPAAARADHRHLRGRMPTATIRQLLTTRPPAGPATGRPAHPIPGHSRGAGQQAAPAAAHHFLSHSP